MYKNIIEKYIKDGICKNSKDIFIVYDDGTLEYLENFYNDDGELKGQIVNKSPDVWFQDVGNKGGVRINYGNKNASGMAASCSFKNYDDGELDKRWKRIDNLE